MAFDLEALVARFKVEARNDGGSGSIRSIESGARTAKVRAA